MIKLFKVQEVAASGPTLSSPRGAVDAVGSNIVNRIGNMNLRGVARTGTGTGSTGLEGQAHTGIGTGSGAGSRPAQGNSRESSGTRSAVV